MIPDIIGSLLNSERYDAALTSIKRQRAEHFPERARLITICERGVHLQEREAIVEALLACVTTRETACAAREKAAATRETVVAAREKGVAKREVAVYTRRATITASEAAVAARETAREGTVAKREAALCRTARRATNTASVAAVAARETAIATSTAALIPNKRATNTASVAAVTGRDWFHKSTPWNLAQSQYKQLTGVSSSIPPHPNYYATLADDHDSLGPSHQPLSLSSLVVTPPASPSTNARPHIAQQITINASAKRPTATHQRPTRSTCPRQRMVDGSRGVSRAVNSPPAPGTVHSSNVRNAQLDDQTQRHLQTIKKGGRDRLTRFKHAVAQHHRL